MPWSWYSTTEASPLATRKFCPCTRTKSLWAATKTHCGQKKKMKKKKKECFIGTFIEEHHRGWRYRKQKKRIKVSMGSGLSPQNYKIGTHGLHPTSSLASSVWSLSFLSHFLMLQAGVLWTLPLRWRLPCRMLIKDDYYPDLWQGHAGNSRQKSSVLSAGPRQTGHTWAKERTYWTVRWEREMDCFCLTFYATARLLIEKWRS